VPGPNSVLDVHETDLPEVGRKVLRHKQPNPTFLRVANLTLVAAVLFVPAYMSLHSSAIFDTDIWWHLSTGQWISAHHAVPHLEPFSGPMAGTPWVAYSWLFELLTFGLFQRFGVPGLLIYTASLLILISTAVFRLVSRNNRQLPAATLLTFACMYSMNHLYTPRPWLFTILFFTLELDLLLEVRRTGLKRRLLWLPLLFAAWANIHIQFVYGLFLLIIAVAEAIAARRWKRLSTMAAPGPLLAALAFSLLATMFNPYGWKIYAVAHDFATQSGALNTIGELQAIPFRDLANYGALIFALGSAAVLGWTRRYISLEGVLLVFAAYVSFRSQRDAWLIAVAGAAILSNLLPEIRKPALRPSKYLTPASLAIAACLLAAAFRSPQLSDSSLRQRQAQQLPVRAVEFVRERGYPGPLFNDFNWGGYLIWNLRMPVSLDGRQNVYGDERIARSVATWNAGHGWSSDPELTSAHLIIGPAGAPLTQLLRTNSHFQLAYEDQVAAVFVAHN